MEEFMMLENKTALIYGAGGAIGGAVARAFSDATTPLHISRGRSVLWRPAGPHSSGDSFRAFRPINDPLRLLR